MEKLRAAKCNDEHLATQLLKLKQENEKLKEENIHLRSIYSQLTAPDGVPRQLKELTEQNESLKKHNSNLSSEHIKLCREISTLIDKTNLIGQLNQRINILEAGLESVIDSGIFSRKSIAENTLFNRDHLLDGRKI